MEKILITGANGFVGRVACEEFSARGFSVVAAVRTEALESRPDAKVISVGSIDAKTDWTSALTGCSTVLHLAGRAHILNEDSTNALEKFRATNVDGSIQLARSAAEHGVRRFVFVSSIGVHGQYRGLPFNERDTPQPFDAYAISKLEAEIALRDLAAETGLEIVIVRPPLVYGPGCPGNFRRLLKLIDSGMPLPFGSIKCKRSFVSVWNLVDFLIRCVSHPEAGGETFLVSDLSDVTLPELIRMLAAGMKRRALLLPVNEKLLSVAARALGKDKVYEKLCGPLNVNSAHAAGMLGWTPPVSLVDGLYRTGAAYVSGATLGA
jgi:UDP-glucose 4-epimerase